MELGGGEGEGGVGEEGGAGDLEGVEEEEFGVAGGVVAELGMGGELGGGDGEGFAEGHGLCVWGGTPPSPGKVCKVFKTNDLSLDFHAGPD